MNTAARKATGGNVLDSAHRGASARAGHAQSAGVAESVATAADEAETTTFSVAEATCN